MPVVPAGPEEILEIDEPRFGLVAFIVIDSTLRGPAFGGIRIRAYAEERHALLEALDLAAAMTQKASLARLPCGGGKIVVIDRPELRRARAIETIGGALNDLRGRFFAGRDYGMTSADLTRLRRITRYAADESSRAMGDLGDATARGAIAAIRAALAYAGLASRRRGRGAPRPLAGVTAAVQGLGTVGLPLARRLLEDGAVLVAADPDPRAARRGARLGARIVAPGRLSAVRADLFVPAAEGGTIDESFARRCRARVVCGPANNQLRSPHAAEILRERGIVWVPDPLVSAGALIQGALFQLEGIRDAGPAIDAIGPRVARWLRESASPARRRTGLSLAAIDPRRR